MMQKHHTDIVFKVILEDEEHEIRTFIGEYRNLMALLYDKFYLDEFGECRGMGRCGTCLIELIETGSTLTAFDRNEQTTLIKTGIKNPAIRLACQLLVNESLNHIKIRILNS